MAGKFCVSLTSAKDNTDKATVAFVVANAAVASDKETMVFLSTEGVRLSEKGYADDIHEEGFSAARADREFCQGRWPDLRVLPLFQAPQARREQPGARGGDRRGARLVEFLSDGSPSVSY